MAGRRRAAWRPADRTGWHCGSCRRTRRPQAPDRSLAAVVPAGSPRRAPRADAAATRGHPGRVSLRRSRRGATERRTVYPSPAPPEGSLPRCRPRRLPAAASTSRDDLPGAVGIATCGADALFVLAADIDARLVLPAIAAVLRARSEEHTSELQSLMRISYAVFCLKKQTP